jgi:hypothetical protein
VIVTTNLSSGRTVNRGTALRQAPTGINHVLDYYAKVALNFRIAPSIAQYFGSSPLHKYHNHCVSVDKAQ